jgi:hypothetical protein
MRVKNKVEKKRKTEAEKTLQVAVQMPLFDTPFNPIRKKNQENEKMRNVEIEY